MYSSRAPQKKNIKQGLQTQEEYCTFLQYVLNINNTAVRLLYILYNNLTAERKQD